MAFEVGQRVGDYEIVQLLGVGGMGHVYRVRNVISDRTEAMKVLLPDLTVDRDLAIRFISEIRTLASFDHPNIALLHTAFQSDNQLIMMMEFVEGSTLEQKAKQSSMSIEEVCGYTYQALSALSYAHGRGVVHRDIKPANIMLTSHGIVKLMDFGIAKSNVETNLTRPGTTIGSLYYMSPEQVRGDAVDGRSDLYSVGIMLYELLAGRRPFEADTTFSILNQQLNTPPQPPIELNPSLPRALNDVILHALAKSPDERYQSADNFKDALRPFCPNQSTEPGHVAVAAGTPVAAAGGAAAAIAAVEAASATAAMPAAAPVTAATPPPFAPVAVPGTPPPPASTYPPASGYPSASGYPPPTPKGQKGGHKGLWIGTGIAAAILAMVGLAIGLPHLMGTRAAESSNGSQTSSPTSAPSPASTPATTPANTQVESQTSTAPADTQQGVQTSPAPAGTQQSTQVPDSSGVMNGTGGSNGHTAARQGSGAMRGPNAVVYGQPNHGASIDAAVAPPDEPAARPNVSAAQMEEAQSHFTELTSRAGAVDDSLNHLRRQQEASGYGLRGDMASADSQMQSFLRAADQDLRSSNVPAAKRDMARAEQALTTLEKFLGK